MPQTATRRTTAVNRLVWQLMKTVLGASPGASHARFALLHSGTVSLGTMQQAQYDMTHSVSASGRSLSVISCNQPVTNLRQFLPALLAGKSSVRQIFVSGVATPFNDALPSASTILACPGIGPDKEIGGILFIQWDGCRQPRGKQGLPTLITLVARAAAQVAAVLDLHRHASPLPQTFDRDIHFEPI